MKPTAKIIRPQRGQAEIYAANRFGRYCRVYWLGDSLGRKEKALSAIWPAFGVHQRAFEEAIKNGGQFTAEMAGILAALIAGENTRAPLVVGCLLLALGILKAVMSWQYVPIGYHVIFTAILFPMAIIGGKLITTT